MGCRQMESRKDKAKEAQKGMSRYNVLFMTYVYSTTYMRTGSYYNFPLFYYL